MDNEIILGFVTLTIFSLMFAIASIAHNVGITMFIAGLSHYGQRSVPTRLTCMILGALLAIPYSVWSKRRMTLSEAAGATEYRWTRHLK